MSSNTKELHPINSITYNEFLKSLQDFPLTQILALILRDAVDPAAISGRTITDYHQPAFIIKAAAPADQAIATLLLEINTESRHQTTIGLLSVQEISIDSYQAKKWDPYYDDVRIRAKERKDWNYPDPIRIDKIRLGFVPENYRDEQNQLYPRFSTWAITKIFLPLEKHVSELATKNPIKTIPRENYFKRMEPPAWLFNSP